MERNPMIKVDYDTLPEIDAIFLSHSHCDHVDPYTLIEMYKNRHPRPLLLIPETIEFLIPLFKEYLPKQKIQVLKNEQIFNLN
ncbi:MAG: MBL fold metallo-hydrolase [Patescibacteria group bacterium]|nr:MBL fold metallo-hydrolase [Patescibacteria group bacterium]